MKQIIFTPENDSEKFALKLITPDDNIELALTNGTFHDSNSPKPFTAQVNSCRGGYLRAFSDEDSVMLVLKPKPKSELNP